MSSPLADVVAGARRALELEWAREEQRSLELTEQEKWARHPVGWINEHVRIASFLPSEGLDRQQLRPVRMRLFPDQERTLAEWIDLPYLQQTGQVRFRANLVIEKSRQIGETWLFAAAIAWLVHHHRVNGLCMHVDLAEIDDGGRANTHKSLFGKVRYIDQGLSRDRLPYLAGPLVFKQKPSKIEAPRTGSVVYGEGQSDDPGRGQSLDFAVVDEAARVQHGELVHASLADACPTGKAYLSTPFGNDNMHARLASTKPRGWTYLRLHWSQHPVYGQDQHIAGDRPDCVLCEGNRQGVRWEASDPRAHRYPGKLTSPWYDEAVLDKTDEQVASELDIDRARALTGRVYPEFDPDVHVVADGIEIELDENLRPLVPFELAVDYGTDTTSVLVLQNAPLEVRVVGIVELGTQHGTDALPERVAEELRLLLQELGLPHLETTPDFSRHLRAIGDPAGHAREQSSGRTLVSFYRRQGFNIQKPPSRLTARIEFSLHAVKRLLIGQPKPLRVCGVRADAFVQHMLANRWKTNAVGSVVHGRAMNLEDDIHNHACRAFAYWAVATFPPPDERTHHPLTSDPDEPRPHLPLTERRRRQARRVTAGGDLDEALPFDDNDSL